MKRYVIGGLASFVAVLVIALGLSGCKTRPEDVAVEFLESLAAGDVDAGWERLTEESKAIFDESGHGKDVLRAWSEKFKKTDFTFKVKEVKENEGSATVKVIEISEGKELSVDTMSLVRDQDGAWRISIEK